MKYDLLTITKFIAATLFPVALSVALYIIERKTKFGKMKYWGKQTITGVLFGGIAVAATEFGKPAVELKAGKVVVIPAGVEHWHGAKANSWFSHIAIEIAGENCKTEWCESVTDEEYKKL